MKPLISFLAALWLCLSPALAQGDPGDGEQSGIDVFSVGMTKAEAKRLGAKADGKNDMTASVSWGDADWDVRMTFKGKKATVVALRSEELDNGKVYQMLQDMEERLYQPLFTTREVKGKEKERDFMQLAAKGRTEEQRGEVLQKEISAYADQEDGSLLIVFGPGAMLDQLVEVQKTEGDEDAALSEFSDTVVYSMKMEKSDDSITVMAATMNTMNDM